jgi:putative tryptophan/tyrosine transport system substrate-binding protein
MRRRTFIATLCGAATWPPASQARQPNRVRRFGVLMGYAETDPTAQAFLATFRQGLAALGGAKEKVCTSNFDGPHATSIAPSHWRRNCGIAGRCNAGLTTPITAALQHESKTIPARTRSVPDSVLKASSRRGSDAARRV